MPSGDLLRLLLTSPPRALLERVIGSTVAAASPLLDDQKPKATALRASSTRTHASNTASALRACKCSYTAPFPCFNMRRQCRASMGARIASHRVCGGRFQVAPAQRDRAQRELGLGAEGEQLPLLEVECPAVVRLCAGRRSDVQ